MNVRDFVQKLKQNKNKSKNPKIFISKLLNFLTKRESDVNCCKREMIGRAFVLFSSRPCLCKLLFHSMVGRVFTVFSPIPFYFVMK